MPTSPRTKPPVIGLRERKKAKTRLAVQEHALRLFRTRGYEETTVEDIAAAAEISPSTFFRYFPTKEDVVMYDVLDDALFDVFRAIPKEVPPVEALRRTLRQAYGLLSPELEASLEQRDKLARTVPALRTKLLEEYVRAIDLLLTLFAERTGRRRDDPELETFAGAVVGVLMVAHAKGTHHFRDYLKTLDRALELLGRALPLRPKPHAT